MNLKKSITVISVFCLVVMLLTSCGSKTNVSTTDPNNTVTLNIAYQYGLAYAPLMICQEQQLIEKEYEKAGGANVSVIWNQMSSGADINTGIASGNLDVGFMGIAPAIIGISKNVGYKIFTNLSGQEHGLMTNDPDILSLDDIIANNKQIALVNTGSIQHIILGMALVDNGYDAHSMDSNIVAMKHPDGMAALSSGNVSCHLTSNPYIYMEREDSTLHELNEIQKIWDVDRSFIVGVASTSLPDSNPQLYQALVNALNTSMDLISSSPESAAQITAKYDGNDYDDELRYLKLGSYSSATSGITELAKFMYDYGFIDTQISNYSDLTFDNVSGD